jgi:hypothetical protein
MASCFAAGLLRWDRKRAIGEAGWWRFAAMTALWS